VTLPVGSVGDTVELVDYAGTWDTNNCSIVANGSEKIKGSVAIHKASKEREGIKLVYVDATQGWLVVTAANEGTEAIAIPTYSVGYLVIAGGGGGGGPGHYGGGAAGGYRTSEGTSGGGASAESALTLSGGISYTLTVGAGSASHTNGNNSVFATVTSTGGGTGGSSGGSGGGNGHSADGAAGTAGQGYAGGNGSYAGAPYTGGGGGGASAVGTNGTTLKAGNGGAGVASSITGSSITYAGGGGGGAYAPTGPTQGGTGGTGGGGNGGAWHSVGGNSYCYIGQNGSVNTGGGGGSGVGYTDASGGGQGLTGGSGIVVLKYSDTLTLTIGGGLTSSTSDSGGYSTTIFTAGTDTISIS
jgi:hypothetical protein